MAVIGRAADRSVCFAEPQDADDGARAIHLRRVSSVHCVRKAGSEVARVGIALLSVGARDPAFLLVRIVRRWLLHILGMSHSACGYS